MIVTLVRIKKSMDRKAAATKSSKTRSFIFVQVK